MHNAKTHNNIKMIQVPATLHHLPGQPPCLHVQMVSEDDDKERTRTYHNSATDMVNCVNNNLKSNETHTKTNQMHVHVELPDTGNADHATQAKNMLTNSPQ